MKLFLNTILFPFRWLRERAIRWLLTLRAKGQVESMRLAIAEADKIKKTTGRKAIVVYNKSTKRWECIEKQALKRMHKVHKAVKANDRRKRDKQVLAATDTKGMSLERVKGIEKKQVSAS